jgi:LPXTG-site transpeptidase (sortase) family protein
MQNITSVINNVMANKFHFLAVFFCVFTVSYGVLYAFDFYPEPVTSSENTVKATTIEEAVVIDTPAEVKPAATTTEVAIGADTLPVLLTIPALDRTVDVLNPASNSVSALDTALLSGVIRHPDSATFAEEGNMFILGHSSYLPTVHNKNFQALNGMQNLKWGDTITLSSKDTQYTYKVEKNYKAKASGFTVPIAGKGKTLTIVTCNSFGSTEDRYVIEATLISTKPLN